MDQLIETIKKIGYSEKEASIYVALLSLGSSSVQTISEYSRIKRPTTYVILDQLIQRGMVSRLVTKKKRMYVALNPQSLLESAETNYKEIQKVLPEFLTLLTKSSSKKTRVLYFEGVSGMKDALYYRMEELENSTIRAFFGTTKYATKEQISLFHSWNEDLADRKIKLKSIAPKSKSLSDFRLKDKEYGFENKILEKSTYLSNISIDINDKFVRILFFQEKQAIIFENEEFASTLRQIFDIVWLVN